MFTPNRIGDRNRVIVENVKDGERVVSKKVMNQALALAFAAMAAAKCELNIAVTVSRE